jgi:hypothetical protein
MILTCFFGERKKSLDITFGITLDITLATAIDIA